LRVISRKKLKQAAERLSGSEKVLDVWFRAAEKAKWRSLEDVRKTYRDTDGVTVGQKTYTVFNLGGNKFRLIVKIEYDYQMVFIKDVLTHAEYDKEKWKK
jgi:mRNA interferase HigB